MGPPIAVLTPRAPYPLTGGGALRINRLVRGLSERFEVILVTLAHAWENGRWSRADLERTLGVEVVVIEPTEPLYGSRLLTGYRRPEASAMLRSLVERRGVRLIQFEYPHGAQNGPIEGAINVLDAHNVEHEILRQLDEVNGGDAGEEWMTLRRSERTIWRAMDVCLATSALDTETIRAGGARRVFCCPNGSDSLDRLSPAGGRSGPIRALFVGAGDWEPYERGIRWLVSDVLPRVRARHPVRLEVVGRAPLQPVLAEDVRYVGEVPSVEDHYRRAEVVVVPVFEGSGTRLKVIEAMRYGRPVVSTSVGAAGLPIGPGEHYLRADRPGDFASAMIELALGFRAGSPGAKRIVDRARAAVLPLSWPAIAADLSDLYTELLK